MIKYFCDFCGTEIDCNTHDRNEVSYVLIGTGRDKYNLCYSCGYEVMNLIENKRIEKQEVEE